MHALLSKRDARAATAWIGLILLVPLVGWVIYYFFGINRIERRAQTLRAGYDGGEAMNLLPESVLTAAGGSQHAGRHLQRFSQHGLAVSPIPYVRGNRLTLLKNGDEAYPAMIAAIEKAEHTVALCTYIFNHDKAGKAFLEALANARARGVKVRVLIDGVGSHYSVPSMIHFLRQKGIPCERFLHSFLPWQMPYLNLRNHQKILVVDGKTGFTGSMNIAEGNLVADNPAHPILDRHFQIGGPLVGQLMTTFAQEWRFATDEILTGAKWFPDLEEQGEVIARGVPAGPDQPRNPLRWLLLGAISQAEESIRIITPYFLPDTTLQAVLSVAAMRGVQVDIVLPENNNLFYMQWAMTPQFDELIDAGCRVYMTPGPFDHTKLLVVDGMWSFVGSANWDARSLRLNFEFNVEAFSRSFAAEIAAEADARIAKAWRLEISHLQARPTLFKVRDNLVRLFSPYL
ncbi:phospholipase D-like domain-containing protein [Tepidicaulis sp. LMO-SS28]|uniref:phospholipase D-like domain-containing protein n=1 Tax=Tepidicaulis sp. LMO-SS28 TaxID=3447455 RepID=UPI003EDEBA8D